MSKHLSVLFVFILVGCASTQYQSRFADNTFSCDHPKLTVRILKKVVRHKEGSKQLNGFTRISHSYMTESGEFVGINIWRFRHKSNAGWRTSDEQIIMNIGMVPLKPTRINNQTWIKFVDLKNEKYIAFGYFKRIDWNLVAVYSISKTEALKDEIGSFNYKSVLNDYEKQILNRAFNSNVSLFEIK